MSLMHRLDFLCVATACAYVVLLQRATFPSLPCLRDDNPPRRPLFTTLKFRCFSGTLLLPESWSNPNLDRVLGRERALGCFPHGSLGQMRACCSPPSSSMKWDWGGQGVPRVI